jgi:hypothetical protein
VKFENLHDFNGSSNYVVVNELLHVWDEVLSDVKGVKRAASICSGGEVSFFNILPKVEESLECIDHSLGSMYWALGKYHTIEKLGAAKAHEFFKGPIRDGKYDRDRYGYAAKYVPGPKEKKFHELFAEANGKYTTNYLGEHKTRGYDPYGLESLCPLYNDISLDAIKKFRANRTKITFIHGDLNDLIERGPFDLVYLSNALEYQGRNGSQFNIRAAVKEGGYIALTTGSSRTLHSCVDSLVREKVVGPADYRDANRKRDARYGMYSWTYMLLRNEEDPNYAARWTCGYCGTSNNGNVSNCGYCRHPKRDYTKTY